MPDFQRVDAPHFSPTQCLACTTHKHPDGFVDLLAENALGHRMYLCAGCLYQAAQKLGCLSPTQGDDLARRLGDANGRIHGLETALEAERGNKVVSLDDVRKLLRTKQPA